MRGVTLVTNPNVLPRSHTRHVLRSIQRDSFERMQVARDIEHAGFTVTSQICNGELNDIRYLCSCWDEDVTRLHEDVLFDDNGEGYYRSINPISAMVSYKDIDFNIYPSWVPVYYMLKESRHYSCDELEKHCVMSVAISESVCAKVYPSIDEKSARVYFDKENDIMYVSALMSFWKKYISCKIPFPSVLQKEIEELFYKFYPRPSSPVMCGTVESEEYPK